VVGTGSGTPEVPELPSARGWSCATLSPGVIIRGHGPPGWGLGVGLTTPHHKRTAVTEQINTQSEKRKREKERRQKRRKCVKGTQITRNRV
jgi:hypothetical protein